MRALQISDALNDTNEEEWPGSALEFLRWGTVFFKEAPRKSELNRLTRRVSD